MATEDGGLLFDGAIVMVVLLLIAVALTRTIGWNGIVYLVNLARHLV